MVVDGLVAGRPIVVGDQEAIRMLAFEVVAAMLR